MAEGGGQLPAFPSVFVRFAVRSWATSSRSSFRGFRPTTITKANWRWSSGRTAGISREQALAHVAGYSCFNEACYRDYQFKHSLIAGKNFAASGAFGPWLVTADEIPDPSRLELKTRLNGTEVQHAMVDRPDL